MNKKARIILSLQKHDALSMLKLEVMLMRPNAFMLRFRPHRDLAMDTLISYRSSILTYFKNAHFIILCAQRSLIAPAFTLERISIDLSVDNVKNKRIRGTYQQSREAQPAAIRIASLDGSAVILRLAPKICDLVA